MDLYQRELAQWAKETIIFAPERFYKKKILISGATGMLGRCLIDLLMYWKKISKCEFEIIALSRNKEKAETYFEKYWKDSGFRYVSCDVNETIPECGDVDYVLHAASNTHPMQYAKDPIGTIDTNVFGTKHMLDYAVRNGAERFCFFSSVEVYGENICDVERFVERDLGYIDCNTLRAGYPEAKRLGETMCNAYYEAYSLDFVIVRLSRIYGPTMSETDSKVIAQFLKNVAKNEDIELKSDGKQKYSYTFVTDAVAAIMYALLEGETGEAYNIADPGSEVVIGDIAAYIAEKAKRKVVSQMTNKEEQKGFSNSKKAILDSSKLQKLGWMSRIHMQEGIMYLLDSWPQGSKKVVDK